MNFREAMDALGLTAPEVAEAFQMTTQTIRQMRLDPDRPGYRSPPPSWRSMLAQIGKDKGEELSTVVRQLEGERGA
jgi:hypothetical protein